MGSDADVGGFGDEKIRKFLSDCLYFPSNIKGKFIG